MSTPWPQALREYNDWADADLHLQQANSSALHQLLEDHRCDRLVKPPVLADFDWEAHNSAALDHSFQTFVICHDWARAFANSNMTDSDPLSPQNLPPYEHCCFEYQISGKRVCHLRRFENNQTIDCAFLRLAAGDWIQPPLLRPRGQRLHKVLYQQYLAISVALDAAVAKTNVVRAPFKLNKAREKRGRVPAFDYHVVELARRSRPATLPEEHGEHRSPRLHFRRGHWRHFENSKTWINWTLVGDPDLGFIDKHYRL